MTTYVPVEELPYDAEVARATDPLYARVADQIPSRDWPAIAARIHAINRLKAEHNAVILAHNYMSTPIFALAGDFRGDSLQLAREAARVKADVIVQAGVHFMAETSKILSPDKRVLIPETRAGCSLAASITARDVALIRERYPDLPIVTYVNTSAEVKAASDICCTSSNAVAVVEAIARQWGVDRVVMIPDEYLARNVASRTTVGVIAWHGRCEVHERYSAGQIAALRRRYPGTVVLAHPECPPEVLEAADFAGSTAALEHYVDARRPQRIVMLTECSMSDNVMTRHPEIEFVRACTLCPHMQRITLDNIYEALATGQHEVHIDEDVAHKARAAIEAMLALPVSAAPRDFTTAATPREVVVL